MTPVDDEEVAKDPLMYYEENLTSEPDYRWCGFVVQQDREDEVLASTYRASQRELQVWFEGWLDGWRSRIFHEECYKELEDH